MNVLEVNQTDKAKKKLAKIAQNNSLDNDFVYFLFSFYWNYDGIEADWVKDLEKDNEYIKRQEIIFNKLGLDGIKMTKNTVIETVYKNLREKDTNKIKNNFLYGSINCGYCFVSEYASYYYLNNATKMKLETLEWNTANYTDENIIKNIFYKIFRGGSVDRYNLEYLYADLVIKMEYNNRVDCTAKDWTDDFVKDINGDKLSDLIKLLKKYCNGDKYYLQTVLEALSYSGKIKVPGHDISKIFIPDYRNELSKNYYANEWTYPLRFWSKK
jgi:hypothetical protein